MKYVLDTAPTAEPVTLSEAKAHLRLEHDAEDADIIGLISAARQAIEQETDRSLMTQSWSLWLDRWPPSERREPWWDGVREGSITEFAGGASLVRLRKQPIQSIDAVTVFDSDDNGEAFAGVRLTADGRLATQANTLPPIPTRGTDGIRIQFTAGYTDVPADLKHAVKLLVANWWVQREPILTGTIRASMPRSLDSILARYKDARL